MSDIVLIGSNRLNHVVKDADSFGDAEEYSLGGAGLNISRNLAYLGNRVTFLTALGNDEYGDRILSELKGLGVEVVYPERKYPTPRFEGKLDAEGQLKGSYVNAKADEALKAPFFMQHVATILKYEHLFFDTDIGQQGIIDLMRSFPNMKICIYGIAQPKMRRFVRFLPRTHLFYGDYKEMKELVGMKKEATLQETVDTIRSSGVQNVITNNGGKEIYYSNPFDWGYLEVKPLEESRIVNRIGATAAFYAGFLDGFVRKKKFVENLKFGLEVTNRTMQVKGETNPDIADLVAKTEGE